MGWRPEERSSSDVGQWTTLLRRLLGHFAISTTSVECYGLSHACFYLRLSSNITTRVWIDNLYHIKPGKYHGVGTLRVACEPLLRDMIWVNCAVFEIARVRLSEKSNYYLLGQDKKFCTYFPSDR